jgi:acyl-lipid omega-6 desaturase (Delta-12 desaturase)
MMHNTTATAERFGAADCAIVRRTPMAPPSASASASDWTRRLAVYRTPKTVRAIGELIITAVPFALTWYFMAWAVLNGHVWLYLLLLFPTVGFLVRLFLIQHDCGHYAFFASRQANDWVGRAIGVVTLTAYDHWRRAHSIHHATSGNLDRRGVGDIDTITVDEYLARPRWTRLRYRVYRHPLIMFAIGPLFIFVVQNRLPAGFMFSGWMSWVSTMSTNLAIAVLSTVIIHFIGWKSFLLVAAPIMAFSATIGGWLFYVQHQFSETFWEKGKEWNWRDASFRGSSHYDLPRILRWFTANIGVHHVHHLCSRIPYYRLQKVLVDHPELQGMGRLTLRESFGCMRLVLWDEKSHRLISFRQLPATA